MNSPMQPDQHGYGDESDCLCGRNFSTVRGLREHLTKSRKVTDTDLLLKLSDQAVTSWRALEAENRTLRIDLSTCERLAREFEKNLSHGLPREHPLIMTRTGWK